MYIYIYIYIYIYFWTAAPVRRVGSCRQTVPPLVGVTACRACRGTRKDTLKDGADRGAATGPAVVSTNHAASIRRTRGPVLVGVTAAAGRKPGASDCLLFKSI